MRMVVSCMLWDGPLLLLGERTDCKLFCTPGGKVAVGESMVAAAIREFKEETGVTSCNVRYDKQIVLDELGMVIGFYTVNSYSGLVKNMEARNGQWSFIDPMSVFPSKIVLGLRKYFEIDQRHINIRSRKRF